MKHLKHLDELIEQATIDCYGDDEERTAMQTAAKEGLLVPFETNILGILVTVIRVGINEVGELVAVCKSNRKRQRVSLVDLPLQDPAASGAEWIFAYRQWVSRFS
jgi:hypothetical protein